jgi:hypothetical protein
MCYNSIGGMADGIRALFRPSDGFFRDLRYTGALQSGLQDEFNENPLRQIVNRPVMGNSEVR